MQPLHHLCLILVCGPLVWVAFQANSDAGPAVPTTKAVATIPVEGRSPVRQSAAQVRDRTLRLPSADAGVPAVQGPSVEREAQAPKLFLESLPPGLTQLGE